MTPKFNLPKISKNTSATLYLVFSNYLYESLLNKTFSVNYLRRFCIRSMQVIGL